MTTVFITNTVAPGNGNRWKANIGRVGKGQMIGGGATHEKEKQTSDGDRLMVFLNSIFKLEPSLVFYEFITKDAETFDWKRILWT